MLGYPEINIVFWTLWQEVQFYLIYTAGLYRAGPTNTGRAMALMFAVAALFSLLWPLGSLTDRPRGGSFLPITEGPLRITGSPSFRMRSKEGQCAVCPI
jgi:peptidoglycan/LPS O-acetylase OafA/YrhL